MEASAEKQKSNGKTELTRHGIDFPLFIGILIICAFGLVMMYSASYYYGLTKLGDGAYFLKRQAIFLGIGMAGLFILSNIKFTFYRNGVVAILMYAGVIGLTFLTLLFPPINEARRWIPLGFFNLQPTELGKLVIVIALANIMSRKVPMQNFIAGMAPCLIVLVGLCVPTILQPNFSMVVIYALITYLMLYLGGTRRSHRLLLVLVGAAAGAALIIKEPYRLTRILTFINPEADPTGAGFQPLQSRIALANGGLFGQGLNFSRQKLLFLPERENDYILSIIGEELGFIGIVLLLAAYFFVIWRCIRIALYCPDKFGRLLAGGLTGVFAMQVIINVGVVSGAMPSTGQTLPLISYGGTSMIVFLALFGMILNVSRYTEVGMKNAKRTKE